MLEILRHKWYSSFGSNPPEVIIRAPGRVNIIGEHTDYNEGWVLPGAMSRSIYLLLSRDTTNHHWIAYDLDQEIRTAEEMVEYGAYSWARYIQGALSLYAPGIGPLRILVGGDLPVGAGISSSSALVCGILYALQQLTGGKETKEELALTGSRVEREIIGLQGGIMDQFAIMLCQPHHVMLLDCRHRTYDHINADLHGCQWILINTKVKHQLIDSDYNQRASQCAQAVKIIQSLFPEVKSLRDVTMEMLLQVNLPEILLRRSTFVLQENDRVHEMVKALISKNASTAGHLLRASHKGLRDQYEVSCEELDFVADFSNSFPGVQGARMMGGGFGGCVICLLPGDVIEEFVAGCISSYENAFGFEPEIIYFELGAGVSRIET